MKQIITSLDCGTDKIKLIVAEIYKDKLNILACAEVKSKGIKKGIIVSPEEAIVSIKEAFDKCESILGTKIDKVICTVPSYYAEFVFAEGYTTITREDNYINGDDILRCLQSAVYNKVSNNKELVSITPVEFIIDDEETVTDPKGKKGNKLLAKTIITLVPKKNTYALFSILEKLGIIVLDINFNAVADYYEFEDIVEKENCAIINIGSEKTEVSIVNKGILIGTEVFPLGGRNIDRDIAYIYDIYRKDAIRLKEKFAHANTKNSSTSETEEVLTKSNENIKINQYEVSEIVASRLKEILEESKKQINLLTKKENSYIIITGGTSELDGFNEYVETIFGKTPIITGMKEMGVRNNKYSSAVGLIKFYNEKLKFRNKIAYTIDEEKQKELFNSKKKFGNDNLLGKIYSYFFDN